MEGRGLKFYIHETGETIEISECRVRKTRSEGKYLNLDIDSEYTETFKEIDFYFTLY